ncbi:MAG: cytochrome c family protein [Terricaulis sp.]
MSDLKFNSMAGALLASVLGIMIVGIGASAVVHSQYPEKPGFLPQVAESASGGGGPAAPAGPPDFGRLFADEAGLAALIVRGDRVHAQCKSCHNFDAGGPNGTGPNLHDVFGRAIGAHSGFTYSDPMMGMNGSWDYLHLNDFLRSPAAFVPGTRMTFAGVRNDQDRVALIAYLRSISPNQVPLPAPLPEVAPAGDAAAADGEAANQAAPAH